MSTPRNLTAILYRYVKPVNYPAQHLHAEPEIFIRFNDSQVTSFPDFITDQRSKPRPYSNKETYKARMQATNGFH